MKQQILGVFIEQLQLGCSLKHLLSEKSHNCNCVYDCNRTMYDYNRTILDCKRDCVSAKAIKVSIDHKVTFLSPS